MAKFQTYFHQAIRDRFPGRAGSLIMALEAQAASLQEDTAFAARSANPMDRRLDITAWFLALIRVLEREGYSYEQIRTASLDVAEAYVRPKNAVQAWLRRLPAAFVTTGLANFLLRKMERRLRGRAHPDGFVVKIITDKAATYGLGYGVDILECGICKLFQKHDAAKYAPILCEIDYITTRLAGLDLVRGGTIANGAAKCDFRFKKAK